MVLQTFCLFGTFFQLVKIPLKLLKHQRSYILKQSQMKNFVQKEFSFYFDFITEDKISNKIRNLDKTIP